tara:strand:- start:218 stop:1348 length:1131 start_codon:yes stop_codon:yes gene_type:complete
MENKQTNEKRQFLGIWIPRDIYLNKKLSWTDKILLVEIESLDNERGCFASNDYFAEFLSCTTTTISTSISKLKKLGYVKQISFDGRTRVLKAEFKKVEKQTLKKVKSRQPEILKHNKQDNKKDNKPIKKEKIYKKDFLDLDLKDKKKINDIQNGSLCIDVKDLKNEQVWLEHCSRYLKLAQHFTNELLKQFIDEQILKEDSFKSIRETKTHFLNWAKIEVAKNRKFGNDQWGRTTPNYVQSSKPKRDQEPISKQLTEKEKKELHIKFIKTNLLIPYEQFVESGSLRISNFGGLVFKELQKFNLLCKDQKKISVIVKKIEKEKEQKQNGKGRLRRAFAQTQGIGGETNLDLEIIKLSMHQMKNDNVNLKEIILNGTK